MRLSATLVIAFTAIGAAACRPDLSAKPDPADWMLGWFSSASPDDHISVDSNANYMLQGTVPSMLPHRSHTAV